MNTNKNKPDIAYLENAKFAMLAAGAGSWNIDPSEPENVYLDERCKALLNITSQLPVSLSTIFKSIHPKERHDVEKAVQKALNASDETQLDLSFRVFTDADSVFNWVRLLGKSFCSKENKTYRVAGIAMDASPQKKLHDQIDFGQQQISAQALAHKELAVSEARFRTIVEQAPVSISMLMGKKLIIETANNNILKLWGKEKSIIGLPLADALPELIGQPFLTILDNVFETGEPYFGYSTMAKLVRNGILEIAYFDFVYTPIRDTNEEITGIMVLATEVTAQVLSHAAIEENERRFRNIVEEAPVATCLLVGRDMKIEVANGKMIDIWGKGWSIVGKPLAEALPELEGQDFLTILDNIFTTGKAFSAKDAPAQLVVNGELKTFYFDFTYKPLFNTLGQVYGIIDMAVDVTEQVMARKKLEESELLSKSIIHNSPVAKMVVVGKDMVIKTANEHMLEMVRHNASIIGLPFEQALPELASTPMFLRLKHVIVTGQTYYQPEDKYELIRYGKPYTGYYNVIYKALPNTEGDFYGVIVTAVEVTDQVNVRNALEVSENRLRSLLESAPFPIGVYTGREMTIALANQSILDVFGKGKDVIGKRYAEILPELANQDIFQQLDAVFTTGIPIHKRNQRVDIVVDGQLQSSYFNYSFMPLYDVSGNIYGVMNTAADVTDLEAAKQQVELTEASLRGAVELAELGTWTIDLTNGRMDYSDRLRDWSGIEKDEEVTIEKTYGLVNESDLEAIKKAIQDAINPFSKNVYDVEYTLTNKITGKERMLHAQGKAFFNEKGEAYKIVGTAQDVTEQRKIQLALEQEVRQRTEELATSNKKLQNANEELEKINDRLLHSNEELAQYAYVASHDLQEPLRKIRMFSSMLGGKEDMPKGNRELIEKIRSSSERMSMLIQDLLEFSRLLKAETLMRPVDIATIMTAVTDDFELTIKEKKAVINVGSLPVIEAVNLQMNQLFYNLLSNALKFTTKEKPPVISVWCELISHEEAAKHIQNILPFSNYYHIIFSDNGIGFESQYSEQIFEVFKRLHGRDAYPGSGIGLALCRRIVANHHGYLFVESELNIGTKFHIIVPDKQHDSQPTLPDNFNLKATQN